MSDDLTPSQQDMLVAVGLGCIVQYPQEIFCLMREGKGAIGNVCPEIYSPTRSGRVLLRKGYVKPFGPSVESFRDAVLTEDGETEFSILLSTEQRTAIMADKQFAEKAEEKSQREQRRRGFYERFQDTIKSLKGRIRVREAESVALQEEMLKLAEQIGRGANDLGAITERLREIVARRDAILADNMADEALMPVYEDDK